jgi:uncharacterized protein YvpB
MVNLPVAYKSQHDSDASGTYNDCGPASIAMILNYYGENLTTDDVYKKTGAGPSLITITQMLRAIMALGYNAAHKVNQSVEDLKGYLDRGLPVIALVHYGSLGATTQDKNFKGGHFFVVVGYREDGYFVNDPNFFGGLRSHGDHHFYPKAEFEKAWEDCRIDKNPVRSFIVIDKKTLPTPPVTPPPGEALITLPERLIHENVGRSWGSEDEKADPEFKGGHLGAARREVTRLKRNIENLEATINSQTDSIFKYVEQAEILHAKIAELQAKLDAQPGEAPVIDPIGPKPAPTDPTPPTPDPQEPPDELEPFRQFVDKVIAFFTNIFK